MRGRPTIYTDELADEICSLLAGGMSLVNIGKMEGMPNPDTVYTWAKENRSGFTEKYTKARITQAHHLAEEIIQIADDGTNDFMKNKDGDEVPDYELVQRSRLRIDARKWYASKLAPKIYGDKLAIGGDESAGPVKFSLDKGDLSV